MEDGREDKKSCLSSKSLFLAAESDIRFILSLRRNEYD